MHLRLIDSLCFQMDVKDAMPCHELKFSVHFLWLKDELEVEMARLKLEIRSTMQLYHSICDQANVAKQQVIYT